MCAVLSRAQASSATSPENKKEVSATADYVGEILVAGLGPAEAKADDDFGIGTRHLNSDAPKPWYAGL